MNFATITPDRGDRPQFLDFCKHQLSRMNTKPGHSYFISNPPTGHQVDLVPRIRLGIERAQADGFDMIFIIENDDFYPKDYFDGIPDANFIGSRVTTYYNLKNNTYQEFHHPERSSLFTTGFKISALANYRWPHDEFVNLDVHLWNGPGALSKVKRTTGAIGIKHGVGKLGGRGHGMTMANEDKNWEWLKKNVDQEAYAFYKTLKL